MTEYEIEDIAGTMIPFRKLQILSIGPMKRLVWQWEVNGEIRSHSEIIEDGVSINASQLRGQLDSAIEEIKNKFPDEEFTRPRWSGH
jgi:hypothetical protein